MESTDSASATVNVAVPSSNETTSATSNDVKPADPNVNESAPKTDNWSQEQQKKNSKNKRKNQFGFSWKERREKQKEKKAKRKAEGATEVKNENKEDKEDEDEKDDSQKIRPDRKRKVALLIAYCGFGYQGLQKNPGAKTIEDEFEKAIYAAGGVSEENRGNFHKMSWLRSCRTDKGVHAVGNIISLKMVIEPDGVVERINSHLPSGLKVLQMYRVLNGFHCKNAVDYRVYEYILPTYAFTPILNNSNFTFTSETRDYVNGLLKLYEGTRNYWNFTVGQKFEDNSSLRFMRSVTCSEPFMVDDVEYVRVTLVGQSFMLHQIRKMIGVLLITTRHSAGPNVILNSFGRQSFNTPIAPGEFLTLDWIAYDGYNKKLQKIGSEFPELHIKEVKEREEFKYSVVYPQVTQQEKKERLMKIFLSKIDTFVPVVDGKERDLYDWLKEQKNSDPTSIVNKPFSLRKAVKEQEALDAATASAPTTTSVAETTTTTTPTTVETTTTTTTVESVTQSNQ